MIVRLILVALFLFAGYEVSQTETVQMYLEGSSETTYSVEQADGSFADLPNEPNPNFYSYNEKNNKYLLIKDKEDKEPANSSTLVLKLGPDEDDSRDKESKGVKYPSQIASTVQKASDAEMLGFESDGFRLYADSEGYPQQSEVELIVQWANWNSDTSENRGGDLLGEAKSRGWALYESISTKDDSFYIEAFDEDYIKVRVSFQDGKLKAGWDFPSEDEPVPTIDAEDQVVIRTEQPVREEETNQQVAEPGATDTRYTGRAFGQS